MFKKRRITPITLIFIVVAIFVITISFILPKYDSSIKNGKAYVFNDGWYLEEDDGSRTPFNDFGKGIDKNKITLVHDHDEELVKIDTLAFYNYYSVVEVYVGGKLIYNYGEQTDIGQYLSLGNYYCMVNIHKHEMSADEIKVVFYSNNAQTVYGFNGGTGWALSRALIEEDILTLLSPIMTMVIVVILIILRVKRATKDLINNDQYWLLIFAIAISAWEVFDTQLLMSLGFNAGSVCFLSFETYMILPIPLIMYIYDTCKKYKKLSISLCTITIINFITLNILELTNTKSFLFSQLSTHIIIGLTLILCLAQVGSYYYEHKDKEASYIFFGYLPFVVFAIIQYLNFFVNPTSSNSIYLQIGLLFFLILQISKVISNVNKRISLFVKQLENQTKFLKKTFKRFVPDDMIQPRLENEEKITKTGSMKYLTVLESDIRGFTELIQNMGADEAIDMLNHYLECMTSVLNRFNAMTLEFVGDSIVALFDEEHVGKNHAEKAVIAAVEMQYVMSSINDWNLKHHYPSFEIGIGVNTGNAYVGYIGSESRIEYDVIGTTINLVSRIEGYSTGGQILISQECMNNIHINIKVANSFSIFPKGFEKPVDVYLITGLGDPYNIDIASEDDNLVTFDDPINIKFKIIEYKNANGEVYDGKIIDISNTKATIVTDYPLRLFDNLVINYYGTISCKVISKSRRGVLVRFTTAPIELKMWKEHLYE